MKTLILFLALIAPAWAETLILPTHPGTNTIDITQPGIRIEGDTIFETLPGPLGIVNQSGTTYKREGNEYVPHKGILGPQNFDLPSYQIESDGSGRETGYIPVPMPQPRREMEWQPKGLLPPLPVIPVRQIQIDNSLEINRLNAELQESRRELRELQEQSSEESGFDYEDGSSEDE